jgi:DNA-binding winged helix-turn-helix (wHTH) protein
MDLAFADCVLNLTARQLLRGGEPVPLEPKMFTLLEVLIRRRPDVVTYAELDELLWPKAYVSRTSLTRLVSELRTLLQDPPGESRIIRTAYKTGYAFAAEVTAAREPGPAPTSFSLLSDERVIPLAEGENLAGRGVECAVVVEASTVSRRHARFLVARGSVTLEDLGSTNGTFVNRVAISGVTPLKDGDEIGLGKALMRLRVIEPSAPTEMITHAAGTKRI